MAFLPGSVVELYAYFRINDNSPLIDTDTLPTYRIYKVGSPSVIYSGTATKESTGVYKATWNSPTSVDTTKEYKIVWTAYIRGNLVPGAEETFRFQDSGPVFSSTDPITIDPTAITIKKQDLDVIKSVLAWPCTENILLSDEQIKQVVIYPALLEYFTKFPLITRDQFPISDHIEIPFPDEYTYGVKDCRVVGKFSQAEGRAPAFWSIVLFNKYAPYSSGISGSYSPKFRGYNPNGLRQATWMYRQVLDTYGNIGTFHYEIDKERRLVIVDANSQGFVEVQWAKWSNDFDKVEYPRRMEVINLAQSNLLQHMVNALQISSETSSEIQLGIAEMQTVATELRERVISRWDTWGDVSVVRVS